LIGNLPLPPSSLQVYLLVRASFAFADDFLALESYLQRRSWVSINKGFIRAILPAVLKQILEELAGELVHVRMVRALGWKA
jgi:hypothetical protein